MVCIACGEKIPSRIKLDGKWKKVSTSRKRCFNCVPFGKRYRINREPNDCICSMCGREYRYKRSHGHTHNKCNSCWQKERRIKLKKRLVSCKGGKCSICGYDKHIEILEFHHLEPSIKDLTIGSSWNRSFQILKEEADKCILVCANCHREIHLKLQGSTVPLL